jgi:hypothetical protein
VKSAVTLGVSVLVLSIASLPSSNPAYAGPADANWTDRREYDLALTIRSETNPQKRLQFLEEWSKQYPASPLKQARLELYLQTYQAMAQPADSFRVTREILKAEPNSALGLYWCTLLVPELPNASADDLAFGEQAAKRLLDSAPGYFKPERKPASTDASEWAKKESVTESLAHRTLGWMNWQRGDLSAAEQEFTEAIQKNNQDRQVSAWMGIVLSLEAGKQSAAIWHLARAATAGEGNTLNDDQRRQAGKMLETIYVSYHGSLDGLDELRKAAASAPFPDTSFSVDSTATVAARREEEQLSLTSPQLAAWLSMRRQLLASDGQQYFDNNLKAKPTNTLKGTVVKASTTHGNRELSLVMTEGGLPEVTVKLISPLTMSLSPGTAITFQGVPESFSPDPFNLVVTAEARDIRRAGR